nr:hypothetical protein [Lachnospiraceae bacterium]
MFKKMMKRMIAVIALVLTLIPALPTKAAGQPKSDYRAWANDDPRWCNVELGNSGLTINDAGCAVIAFDKLLIQAGIKTTAYTPDKLVAWMKSNNQFCTTAGYRAQVRSWSSMATISSDLSYVGSAASPSASKIMSYVNSGYYVILWVTLKNNQGTHFVTVANASSKSSNKPLIWNSTKGVSAAANIDKDPYTCFKSVDAALVYKCTKQTTPPAPSPVTLSNQILPSGTLAKGKAFTVSGKLSSGSNIASVVFTVKNSAGTTMFTASAAPNSKTYSLYSLDSKCTFSKLAAGSYTWTLTATNATECDRWTGSFAVKASTVKVTGLTYPKGTLAKGSTFSCKGNVTSTSKITKVTMSVYSTDGVKQFEASATPNAKSYNLHNLDAKMTFRKLGAGKYVYRVTIVTQDGISTNLVSSSFTVK